MAIPFDAITRRFVKLYSHALLLQHNSFGHSYKATPIESVVSSPLLAPYLSTPIDDQIIIAIISENEVTGYAN